jgi:hypothetical protein
MLPPIPVFRIKMLTQLYKKEAERTTIVDTTISCEQEFTTAT